MIEFHEDPSLIVWCCVVMCGTIVWCVDAEREKRKLYEVLSLR